MDRCVRFWGCRLGISGLRYPRGSMVYLLSPFSLELFGPCPR